MICIPYLSVSFVEKIDMKIYNRWETGLKQPIRISTGTEMITKTGKPLFTGVAISL